MECPCQVKNLNIIHKKTTHNPFSIETPPRACQTSTLYIIIHANIVSIRNPPPSQAPFSRENPTLKSNADRQTSQELYRKGDNDDTRHAYKRARAHIKSTVQ